MSNPTAPSLIVTFADGSRAGWDDGKFFGDDDRVARAVIRSDAALSWEIKDGLVTANSYSIQGAALSLVGDPDFSAVELSGSETFILTPSLLAASIGSWH